MMISFYGLPPTIFLFDACSAKILPKKSIEYPLSSVNTADSCCVIPEFIPESKLWAGKQSEVNHTS